MASSFPVKIMSNKYKLPRMINTWRNHNII